MYPSGSRIDLRRCLDLNGLWVSHRGWAFDWLVGPSSASHSAMWSTWHWSAGTVQPRWPQRCQSSRASSRATPVNNRRLRPASTTTPAESITTRRTTPDRQAAMTSSGARVTPVDDSMRSTARSSGRIGSGSRPRPRRARIRWNVTTPTRTLTTGFGAMPSAGATTAARNTSTSASYRPLRVGSGQLRRGRIRPEFCRPCSDVLGELGVDELLEDADQFGGDHAGAARCPDADRAVDVEHRGAAAIVRDLVVAFGSVEVRKRLPAARDDTEVVEHEVLGVAQQGRGHRFELVADSRVRRQSGDFVRLRDADVALRESFHQVGHHIERPGQLAQPCSVGTRAIRLRCDPLLHRAMAVSGVERPPLPLPHDAGHLCFDRSALQLEFTKPGRQRVVVAVCDPIDEPGLHEIHRNEHTFAEQRRPPCDERNDRIPAFRSSHRRARGTFRP